MIWKVGSKIKWWGVLGSLPKPLFFWHWWDLLGSKSNWTLGGLQRDFCGHHWKDIKSWTRAVTMGMEKGKFWSTLRLQDQAFSSVAVNGAFVLWCKNLMAKTFATKEQGNQPWTPGHQCLQKMNRHARWEFLKHYCFSTPWFQECIGNHCGLDMRLGDQQPNEVRLPVCSKFNSLTTFGHSTLSEVVFYPKCIMLGRARVGCGWWQQRA
jgi:hypothetical protein